MIKKLCVTGAVVAAAAAVSLLAAPAHADVWGNRTRNLEAAQSGNLFGESITQALGHGHLSTDVNNINGTTANAARHGNVNVRYVFD
ncbi:hypothetical protein DP939_09825 [Spongiactinospora rosea]|uniref:Uncharacterized protein n=1 Tax=Spongiactinospora rosea TaxID=2248750 RepID=A0A366M2X6_9ACTN|nr:hypothetical protein [Spongiactinospora rosea]RBQ20110.1 hypothetical protein DP939_09825 [Spongiactinospora rosea]